MKLSWVREESTITEYVLMTKYESKCQCKYVKGIKNDNSKTCSGKIHGRVSLGKSSISVLLD